MNLGYAASGFMGGLANGLNMADQIETNKLKKDAYQQSIDINKWKQEQTQREYEDEQKQREYQLISQQSHYIRSNGLDNDPAIVQAFMRKAASTFGQDWLNQGGPEGHQGKTFEGLMPVGNDQYATVLGVVDKDGRKYSAPTTYGRSADPRDDKVPATTPRGWFELTENFLASHYRNFNNDRKAYAVIDKYYAESQFDSIKAEAGAREAVLKLAAEGDTGPAIKLAQKLNPAVANGVMGQDGNLYLVDAKKQPVVNDQTGQPMVLRVADYVKMHGKQGQETWSVVDMPGVGKVQKSNTTGKYAALPGESGNKVSPGDITARATALGYDPKAMSDDPTAPKQSMQSFVLDKAVNGNPAESTEAMGILAEWDKMNDGRFIPSLGPQIQFSVYKKKYPNRSDEEIWQAIQGYNAEKQRDGGSPQAASQAEQSPSLGISSGTRAASAANIPEGNAVQGGTQERLSTDQAATLMLQKLQETGLYVDWKTVQAEIQKIADPNTGLVDAESWGALWDNMIASASSDSISGGGDFVTQSIR